MQWIFSPLFLQSFNRKFRPEVLIGVSSDRNIFSINSDYKMMTFDIFRTRSCLADAGNTHGRGLTMRFLFHQPHTKLQFCAFRHTVQNANLPQLMAAVKTRYSSGDRDKLSSLHALLLQHWFPGQDKF